MEGTAEDDEALEGSCWRRRGERSTLRLSAGERGEEGEGEGEEEEEEARGLVVAGEDMVEGVAVMIMWEGYGMVRAQCLWHHRNAVGLSYLCRCRDRQAVGRKGGE